MNVSIDSQIYECIVSPSLSNNNRSTSLKRLEKLTVRTMDTSL